MADSDYTPEADIASADEYAGDGLYFIQDERGPIKIGRGLSGKKRLSMLQVGNPYTLTLLGELANKGCVEAFWHVCFDQNRMQGEWFAPTPALRIAIAAALAGEDWTDHVPLIHPNANDLGEWQEHMLDALDAYYDYAWDNQRSVTLPMAARHTIHDPDFDGRCVMTRFVAAQSALVAKYDPPTPAHAHLEAK